VSAEAVPDRGHIILVVEDDDDVRGALAAVLAARGYPVVEADNGRTALQHLRTKGPFCMILLDLFMPDMNGWAFREEQTRDPEIAAVPVVVITADTSAAERISGDGIIGAMTKPVEFERLLAMIGQHC